MGEFRAQRQMPRNARPRSFPTLVNGARLVATLIVTFLALAPHHARAQTVRVVTTAAELQAALSEHLDSVEIRLGPGSYHLIPTSQVESTCGNCQEPATTVPYSLGVRMSGRAVRLVGPDARDAEIVTHAGYGILVEDCVDCAIENLVITGGERDTSGMATDAAIVVRRSDVAIRANRIVDNIGDSGAVARNVVGIMGICGREQSRMLIEGNEILRNSWDGIALYRSANATIRRNVVDGVDAATGARIAGGRGVAIGLTWDAIATVEENLVRRYWKGIGVFVDAAAVVRSNVVENIVTWGISYWDAGKGRPRAEITDNVIYSTGACGASIARSAEGDSPGRFARNVLVRTAQNPKYDSPDYYCFQCALALHAVPEKFVVEDNLFFDNRRADSTLPQLDVGDREFLRAIGRRCAALAHIPSLVRSDFIRRYCSDGELESDRH
jgi:parallel beta-helix repeat protein